MKELEFSINYREIGSDSSLRHNLWNFAGIDLKEPNTYGFPAVEILLGHIATTIARSKYNQMVAKYNILRDDRNNTVTLTVKAKDQNDKSVDFAKFEGNHIIEIMMVPHEMGYRVARCRDAFKSFFTTKDCEYLRKASFPGYSIFDDDILRYAFDLEKLDIPNLEHTGDNFLKFSQIKMLNAPELETVGNYFLYHNEELTNLNAPKLQSVGHGALYNNDKIRKLNLLLLRSVGDNFLYANSRLSDKLTHLPKLKKAGRDCQPLINELVIQNKTKRR